MSKSQGRWIEEGEVWEGEHNSEVYEALSRHLDPFVKQRASFELDEAWGAVDADWFDIWNPQDGMQRDGDFWDRPEVLRAPTEDERHSCELHVNITGPALIDIRGNVYQQSTEALRKMAAELLEGADKLDALAANPPKYRPHVFAVFHEGQEVYRSHDEGCATAYYNARPDELEQRTIYLDASETAA